MSLSSIDHHAEAAPSEKSWAPAMLDFGERALLLILYGTFVMRLAPSVDAHPFNLLLLISESLTVLLILFRSPGAIATGIMAWCVALIGTFGPLLAAPGGFETIPPVLGGLMMTLGLLISLSAKLFLNSSFGIVAANRGVKRAGPYRLVRHPMYFGYGMTHLGFLLLNVSFWNILFYGIAWAAMLVRIREEESFLSQDQAYRDYSAHVRYRLLPGLY
jgi:protein-S-isoprenylcysteine O-methyltransferase Ste14